MDWTPFISKWVLIALRKKCNFCVVLGWDICTLFKAPSWGFCVNRPALLSAVPWGICSFAKTISQMTDKCPGKMGTLGIDRAITQTSGQIKLRQSGQQNRATCFATFLQNQLKSNVARFTAPLRNSTTLYFRQPRFQPNLQQTWFAARQVLFVNGKPPNIAMQLVFPHCFNTSCTFSMPVVWNEYFDTFPRKTERGPCA